MVETLSGVDDVTRTLRSASQARIAVSAPSVSAQMRISAGTKASL
jgi:hypothetical protein